MTADKSKPSSMPTLAGGASKKGKSMLELSKKGSKLSLAASKEEKAPHEIAEVDMSVLSEVKT